jgi:hypothetical protein
MGWNDRVPDEPPYIPYERAEDRDAYDNWQLYLDYCRSELEEHTGGLSSQNVEPGAAPPKKRQLMPSVRRLFHALKELISK